MPSRSTAVLGRHPSMVERHARPRIGSEPGTPLIYSAQTPGEAGFALPSGGRPPPRGWPLPEPSPVQDASSGEIPGLSRSIGQVKRERARWDLKDGKLCPGRAKPEKTGGGPQQS